SCFQELILVNQPILFQKPKICCPQKKCPNGFLCHDWIKTPCLHFYLFGRIRRCFRNNGLLNAANSLNQHVLNAYRLFESQRVLPNVNWNPKLEPNVQYYPYYLGFQVLLELCLMPYTLFLKSEFSRMLKSRNPFCIE